jgi:hypothetical protein
MAAVTGGNPGIRMPSAEPASRPMAGIAATARTRDATASWGAAFDHEAAKNTKLQKTLYIQVFVSSCPSWLKVMGEETAMRLRARG